MFCYSTGIDRILSTSRDDKTTTPPTPPPAHQTTVKSELPNLNPHNFQHVVNLEGLDLPDGNTIGLFACHIFVKINISRVDK